MRDTPFDFVLLQASNTQTYSHEACACSAGGCCRSMPRVNSSQSEQPPPPPPAPGDQYQLRGFICAAYIIGRGVSAYCTCAYTPNTCVQCKSDPNEILKMDSADTSSGWRRLPRQTLRLHSGSKRGIQFKYSDCHDGRPQGCFPASPSIAYAH